MSKEELPEEIKTEDKGDKFLKEAKELISDLKGLVGSLLSAKRDLVQKKKDIELTTINNDPERQ